MAALWLASGTVLPLPKPVAFSDPHPQEARFLVLSESCARCHSAVPTAQALWGSTGQDASPLGTWRASVMANSFADPYWRAQMEREVDLASEAGRPEVRELCTRCHAPAAVHEARLGGDAAPTLAALDADPAAHEGVTCTVCHRMNGEGFGEKKTFDGNLPLDLGANLFGPYPEPFDGPMAAMSGYQIQYGEHVSTSALCATCHTLETGHGEARFLEQSPYLEWRNSVFSYESGETEQSRSCQSCHMPNMGSMNIAHNPMGGDFPFLSPRPDVRSHAIVGGNALLLDLLRLGREELGVRASAAELEQMAQETRRQLSQDTATVDLDEVEWFLDRLRFDVLVENLAGHKLPSGYPSRRMWLEVTVTTEDFPWFESGVPDAQGRIVERGEDFGLVHHNTITSTEQVQVYEMVAHDSEGHATTQLSAMQTLAKDNRLLPLGWAPAGPHGDQTSPVGIGQDEDFVGGGDIVHFDLEIPPEVQKLPGRPMIAVRLLYQSIPPGWADEHRGRKSEASQRFLRLYDAAPTRYEVLAETRRIAR